MLIGHYAPALLLHRIHPSVKLWQLFLATQFVDVLWALFVLTGIEHVRIVPGFTASNDLDLWHMPYSHSLVATIAWAIVAFFVWRSVRPAPTGTVDAGVIALAVASHFVVDLLVHTPDLPVMAAQGPKLGLGLWQHRLLALVIETGLFGAAAVAWWWPRRGARGARAAGGALLLLGAIAVVSFYTPTPPTAVAMTVTALVTYGFTAAIAHWMERKTT